MFFHRIVMTGIWKKLPAWGFNAIGCRKAQGGDWPRGSITQRCVCLTVDDIGFLWKNSMTFKRGFEHRFLMSFVCTMYNWSGIATISSRNTGPLSLSIDTSHHHSENWRRRLTELFVSAEEGWWCTKKDWQGLENHSLYSLEVFCLMMSRLCKNTTLMILLSSRATVKQFLILQVRPSNTLEVVDATLRWFHDISVESNWSTSLSTGYINIIIYI